MTLLAILYHKSKHGILCMHEWNSTRSCLAYSLYLETEQVICNINLWFLRVRTSHKFHCVGVNIMVGFLCCFPLIKTSKHNNRHHRNLCEWDVSKVPISCIIYLFISCIILLYYFCIIFLFILFFIIYCIIYLLFLPISCII